MKVKEQVLERGRGETVNILLCPVNEGGDDCQLFLIGLWFYNVYFTVVCCHILLVDLSNR